MPIILKKPQIIIFVVFYATIMASFFERDNLDTIEERIICKTKLTINLPQPKKRSLP